MRALLNRLLVAVTLLVALPAMALGEKVRAGTGRRVALVVSRGLARACGVRVEVHGGSDLEPGRPRVYVPNHRSHLDIVVVLLARPQVRFIAAQEVFKIPLLAAAMRAMGTMPIDRGDRRHARTQLAEVAAEAAPLEVVVFAEGGIVLPGEPERRFKSGAFVLAIDAQADIVPIAIHGAAEVAPPSRRLLVRPGTVRVDLLPVVPTEGLERADRKPLRAQVEAAVRGALAAPPG